MPAAAVIPAPIAYIEGGEKEVARPRRLPGHMDIDPLGSRQGESRVAGRHCLVEGAAERGPSLRALAGEGCAEAGASPCVAAASGPWGLGLPPSGQQGGLPAACERAERPGCGGDGPQGPRGHLPGATRCPAGGPVCCGAGAPPLHSLGPAELGQWGAQPGERWVGSRSVRLWALGRQPTRQGVGSGPEVYVFGRWVEPRGGQGVGSGPEVCGFGRWVGPTSLRRRPLANHSAPDQGVG